MNPGGNGGPGGPDSPMKISGHFINISPLKKANFNAVWHGPSPGGLLLSILAPKGAALTLNHCARHCVLVSHVHVPHQIFTPTRFSSVSGLFMLNAITYGKDCMKLHEKYELLNLLYNATVHFRLDFRQTRIPNIATATRLKIVRLQVRDSQVL